MNEVNAGNLPDFEHSLAMAGGYFEASELAECHGIACGLLCRDGQATLDDYMVLLDLLEMVNAPLSGFRSSLEALLNSTRSQLVDEDMGLALWLPGDEETLEDRTTALAQWCNGYLAGLGGGAEGSLDHLSEEADEAMKDLQQISMADVTDTDESEDDEKAFAEIVEYIRIVVLIIREELRGPDGQDMIH